MVDTRQPIKSYLAAVACIAVAMLDNSASIAEASSGHASGNLAGFGRPEKD